MGLDAEGFLTWTSKHSTPQATMISQCLGLENQVLGGRKPARQSRLWPEQRWPQPLMQQHQKIFKMEFELPPPKPG